MELQFYGPGYVPPFEGFGCTAHQYRAAMTIDSCVSNKNTGIDNTPKSSTCQEAPYALAPEPADDGQEHSRCHSGPQHQEPRGPAPASDPDRWPGPWRRRHRIAARLTGRAGRRDRHGNHAGG